MLVHQRVAVHHVNHITIFIHFWWPQNFNSIGSIGSIGSIEVIFAFDILDLQGGLDAEKKVTFSTQNSGRKGNKKNSIWVVLFFLWPSVGLCTTLSVRCISSVTQKALELQVTSGKVCASWWCSSFPSKEHLELVQVWWFCWVRDSTFPQSVTTEKLRSRWRATVMG